MTLENLTLVSWARDSLPDYLWVAHLLAVDLDRGLRLGCGTLDLLNEVLDSVLGTTPHDRPIIDGSLTSWETVPEEARHIFVERLEADDLLQQVVPDDFVQVLGMYPTAPGRWLIDRLRERGLAIDPLRAEGALDEILGVALHGQSPVATRAKALALRGLLVAGRLYDASGSDLPDLLSRYPDGLEKDDLDRAESCIRAMFGVVQGPHDSESRSSRQSWAQEFWRSNWRIYPCRIPTKTVTPTDFAPFLDAAMKFGAMVDDLKGSFAAVALRSDPDLYEPDRYEVLTGIAARSLRAVDAAIRSPKDWTDEHSAAAIRSVTEALITITWLGKARDNALYAQFKEYGRGHLKLQMLHLEDYAASLDPVPTSMTSKIEALRRLVNDDLQEEFQSIDIGGSFAGTDIRRMATAVGLETEYRLVLAPASSDFHGEWSHLDRYSLVRCATPSHRGHRIPQLDEPNAPNTEIPELLVHTASRIIEVYVSALADSEV